MPELWLIAVLALAPPVVVVAGVLLVAWRWKSQEWRILAGSCLASCAVFAGGCVALVGSAEQAQLTVRNSTPWQLEVSHVNHGPILVPAGASKRSTVASGPGWIDGYINDLRILGGPDLTTRIFISGIHGQESMTVEIDAQDVGVQKGGEAGSR